MFSLSLRERVGVRVLNVSLSLKERAGVRVLNVPLFLISGTVLPFPLSLRERAGVRVCLPARLQKLPDPFRIRVAEELLRRGFFDQ